MKNLFRTLLVATALLAHSAFAHAQASGNAAVTVQGDVAVTRNIINWTNGSLGTITPGMAKNVSVGPATGSARMDFEFNIASSVYLNSNTTTLGSGTGAATVTMSCGVSNYQDYVSVVMLTDCTTPYNYASPDGMTRRSYHVSFSLPATETAKLKAGTQSADLRFYIAAGT